jgi:hypothetical protein
MWFAFVTLIVINTIGWFLYGISCGERDQVKMLNRLSPNKSRSTKVGPNPFN